MSLVVLVGLPRQAKAETAEDLKINFALCYSSDNSLFVPFSFVYLPSFLCDYFDDYEYYHYTAVKVEVDNTVPLNEGGQFLYEMDAGIFYGFDTNFAISLNYRRYRTPFPEHAAITAWFGKTISPKTGYTTGISVISKKGIGMHFKISQLLTKTMGLSCFTDLYYTAETKLLMGGIELGQKISDGLYVVIDGRCFLFENETKAFVAGGIQFSF